MHDIGAIDSASARSQVGGEADFVHFTFYTLTKEASMMISFTKKQFEPSIN